MLNRLDSLGIASKETSSEMDERIKGHHVRRPTSLFALDELVPETWEADHAPPRVLQHPLEDVMNGAPPSSSLFNDDGTITSPHYSPRTPEEEQQTAAAASSIPLLTKGIALSYGIQVVGQTDIGPPPTEDDRFKARRQLSLLYNDATFYWEEAAPHVFRQIREAFGLSRRQYKASMARLEDEQVGKKTQINLSSSSGP